MLHRPRRTQNGKWAAGYRGVRLCGSCKYAKLPYRLRKSQRPPRPQQSNHRSRSAVIHIRAPWRRIIRGQRVIAARTLPALPRNCAPTCSIIFSPAASHKSRRNWKWVLVIATFVCPKPPRSRAWRLAPPDFAFLGGSSNTVYRAAPRRAFTAQASPKSSAETA